MAWTVIYYELFEAEFKTFSDAVQDAILAHAGLLERECPQLGRPPADTLSGGKHANMKELRLTAGKTTLLQ
jgi:hypothetical protein